MTIRRRMMRKSFASSKAVVSDLALFRRRLLQNPRQISAIAPSSRTLARAMTLGLGPKTGRIVEFGPGTGRFTEAILARGVPPENLTLFELDEEFVPFLRSRLSMPEALRQAIVGAAFDVLAPRGRYVQFTYGSRPPLPPETIAALGLTVNKGHKIWANLPPARVYRFRRA